MFCIIHSPATGSDYFGTYTRRIHGSLFCSAQHNLMNYNQVLNPSNLYVAALMLAKSSNLDAICQSSKHFMLQLLSCWFTEKSLRNKNLNQTDLLTKGRKVFCFYIVVSELKSSFCVIGLLCNPEMTGTFLQFSKDSASSNIFTFGHLILQCASANTLASKAYIFSIL